LSFIATAGAVIAGSDGLGSDAN